MLLNERQTLIKKNFLKRFYYEIPVTLKTNFDN